VPGEKKKKKNRTYRTDDRRATCQAFGCLH